MTSKEIQETVTENNKVHVGPDAWESGEIFFLRQIAAQLAKMNEQVNPPLKKVSSIRTVVELHEENLKLKDQLKSMVRANAELEQELLVLGNYILDFPS